MMSANAHFCHVRLGAVLHLRKICNQRHHRERAAGDAMSTGIDGRKQYLRSLTMPHDMIDLFYFRTQYDGISFDYLA